MKRKKYWLLMLGLTLIIVLFAIKAFVLGALVVLGGLYLMYSYRVAKKAEKPRSELSSTREIKLINTLIIGDYCPERELAKYCDMSKALKIIAPGRTEAASLLILQHVASRLDGKEVCIIAPHKRQKTISPYDIPYLSQITKLEMGLADNSVQRITYLLLHPLLMLSIISSIFCRPLVSDKASKELIDYCQRKEYHLTFLQK